MSIPTAAEPGFEAIPHRVAPTWRFLREKAGQVLGALVFLGLWQGCVQLFAVPQFILPTPSEIIARIVSDALTGLIFVHVEVTVLETLLGFVLASILGIGLGCALGLAPRFERIVYPYILALQTVPKVAVAPLMIIWVGYGIQSKILTAGLIAFFPILVNVVVGLKTVEPRMLLLMRALKAGPLQTFVKVRLPSMLPYLFAGLETGIIFAVIGAIVGEFIGSSQGLGSLIIQRQAGIDVPGVFSILFYLSVVGVILDSALRAVARRYAFWSHRGSGAEQPN
ncbi:MAG: ABC transporter permease [Stellaceae bacterium]